MTGARILIVEDNESLAFGLRTNLEFEGYRTGLATNGRKGLELAREGSWDLMILDLMLAEMDGLQVLSALRTHGSRLPVLILTARGDESDKVLGLRMGADDYVTKPFGVQELIARVDALLRRSRERGLDDAVMVRSRGPTLEGPFRLGAIEVDAGARCVRKEGAEVSLTPKEFDLLMALIRRGGVVATREELLREVWHHLAPVPSRTVDTHVGELRKKLEDDPSDPEYIVTVWKVGYRLGDAVQGNSNGRDGDSASR